MSDANRRLLADVRMFMDRLEMWQQRLLRRSRRAAETRALRSGPRAPLTAQTLSEARNAVIAAQLAPRTDVRHLGARLVLGSTLSALRTTRHVAAWAVRAARGAMRRRV